MDNKFIPQFKVYVHPEAYLALRDVFNSGYIGQGPKVDEFENRLGDVLDTKWGITVNSGTSALWLALHLIGAGPGDQIISSPMTCLATNAVIANRGAEIIWADVDEFGNIDPSSVKEIVGKNDVKAIMAVDWGGLPCDYDGLRAAAPGIPIIEDAAHSFLATYKGQSITKAGGDYISYSTQAIKFLTTIDGGFLVVPPEQYERAKLLRWYGLDRSKADAMRCYQPLDFEVGYKFHMNDVNATVGLCNLPVAIDAVEDHRETAQMYDDVFIERGLLPEWPIDRKSSFWLYTLHVPRPKVFSEWMKKQGVGVSQTHNRNDEYGVFAKFKRSLPNLDRFFDTMTCIPVGWWLSLEDIEYIKQKTISWVENEHKL